MSTYRSLVLRGAVHGSLRTATFRKKEHLVVPVVALVEGVIHAFNAEYPELVLAEEFSRVPTSWNGEPVMLDHPEIDGQKVSANSPEVLERWQLGQVFNARVVDTRLLMDAYIDLERVEEVGEQAQQLIANLQEGKTVEVSVGAFVTPEHKPGVYSDGKRYASIWRDIVPDHLALLPEGLTGACSAEAGCGAGVNRAASVHLITAQGIAPVQEAEPMSEKKEEGSVPKMRSLRERLLSWVREIPSSELRDNEGLSDNDVRRLLDRALYQSEPAYQGIHDVFQEDGLVVYAANVDDAYKIFRRSFTLADGKVTLGSEREEVVPTMVYEAASSTKDKAEETAPRAACGCHNQNESADPGAQVEEKTMHKNAERITALIANPKTGWKEADRAFLETASDEHLAVLEAQVQEPEAPKAVEPKLEDLPKEWQDAITASMRAQEAERQEKIETLAAAQQAFTKDELSAMTTEQLTKMATLLGSKAQVVSFAGRPGARVAASASGVPAPPSLNERFAKKA